MSVLSRVDVVFEMDQSLAQQSYWYGMPDIHTRSILNRTQRIIWEISQNDTIIISPAV
jgi:hypothetical protein